MGIFDRFSSLLKSNINDLISRAEDPEKMLTQILVDMRGQLVKAKQQVASAIADEKRLRDQADAEYKQAQDWERRAMLAIQEGRDDLAKQALVRQGEHIGARPAARADVGAAPPRDGEAQELAPRPERQDRGGQAQEEPPHRPPASRAGAAAHRRDDVVAVREERLRGVRADGGAHRDQRAADQGARRDRGGVHRRHAAARLQAAREGRRRASSVDNQLLALKQKMGMLPAPAPPQNKALGAGQRDEETVHAEIEHPGEEKKR